MLRKGAGYGLTSPTLGESLEGKGCRVDGAGLVGRAERGGAGGGLSNPAWGLKARQAERAQSLDATSRR